MGTAPRLLVCTKGISFGFKGPKRRLADVSLARASDITVGCLLAEGWLHLQDVHVWSI